MENDTSTKKRGRKPKGAKILQSTNQTYWKETETKQNVIVHLKCSLNDAFEITDSVEAYESSSSLLINECYMPVKDGETNNTNKANGDISTKIKLLNYHLNNNHTINKHSACFWCTCDFDTVPVHIPKFLMKEIYYVYGIFCSPECAAGYLMQETIDTSTKYERYFLLNHLYSSIYGYVTMIKPAPNPYYMLDKYMGNLSINAYRQVSKSERLYVLIDKPITKILPEYHEDNDDYIISTKIVLNVDALNTTQKSKSSAVTSNFAKA